KGIDERVQARAQHVARQLVYVPQELERGARGELVPELRALAKHRSNPMAELIAVAPGHEAVDGDDARVRIENAGENLERRRLAGAVRADERDAFAGLDAQRHAV